MKKLFSMLLVLTTLFCLFANTVFAEGEEWIDYIGVKGDRQPIEGENASFDITFTEDSHVRLATFDEVFAAVLATGMDEEWARLWFAKEEYVENGIGIWEEDGVVPFEGTYELGQDYCYCFFLMPEEGYTFGDASELWIDSPAPISVMRNFANFDEGGNCVSDVVGLHVGLYYPAGEAGTRTETIEVEQLFRGLAKEEVPEDFAVLVGRYGLDPDMATVRVSPATCDEYELTETADGTLFRTAVELESPMSYTELWCDVENIEAGGFVLTEASADIDPDALRYEGVASYAAAITSAAITADGPVAGEKAADAKVTVLPEGVELTLDTTWLSVDEQKGEGHLVPAGTAFEAGPDYYLAVDMQTGSAVVDGVTRYYTFTEETEVTVNGEKAGFVWLDEADGTSDCWWCFNAEADEWGDIVYDMTGATVIRAFGPAAEPEVPEEPEEPEKPEEPDVPNTDASCFGWFGLMAVSAWTAFCAQKKEED